MNPDSPTLNPLGTLPRILRYISVPIETLQPADHVLARDENSPEEELVLRQVEERFERTAYVLLHLTLQDAAGRRQTLQTTAEHPVYKLGEGWVAAGELAAGDRIGQADGGVSVVVAARRESHRHGICVYNLRVAECHTYFVRAEGSDAEPVWVHNATNDESIDGGVVKYEGIADTGATPTLSPRLGALHIDGSGIYLGLGRGLDEAEDVA